MTDEVAVPFSMEDFSEQGQTKIKMMFELVYPILMTPDIEIVYPSPVTILHLDVSVPRNVEIKRRN